jgi:peptide/nickel transport system substrate-binding protein
MLRRAFLSTQVPPDGFNRGRYANPEVDKLINDATASLDEAERGRLYRRAQQIIASDAPYISLWAKTNVAIARHDISGITLSPTADFGFLKDVARVVR